MAFRLKLLPTLITLPAILIMLYLGSWQIERLQWKKNLIGLLEARTSATPTEFPNDTITPDAHEFLPVYLEGVFDHSKELLLQNRTNEKQAGMHVLTPFVRSDGKGILLIDRGWVPFEKTGQEFRKDSLVTGAVHIEGVIRYPVGQTSFVPDNSPEKALWYFIDFDAMGRQLGVTFNPYYVMESKTGMEGSLPVGGRWNVVLPNNHLEYALTWYSLALILLVIFIIYHRKKP